MKHSTWLKWVKYRLGYSIFQTFYADSYFKKLVAEKFSNAFVVFKLSCMNLIPLSSNYYLQQIS